MNKKPNVLTGLSEYDNDEMSIAELMRIHIYNMQIIKARHDVQMGIIKRKAFMIFVFLITILASAIILYKGFLV